MAEDEGPSWWGTGRVRASSAESEAQWHALYEFFRHNSNAYSVLRVSISDGMGAFEGTFSDGELATNAAPLRMRSAQFCQQLKEVLDGERAGAVLVQPTRTKGAADGPHAVSTFSVVVRAESWNSGFELVLNLSLPMQVPVFLDRVMPYMAHLEAGLRAESERCEELEKRRTELHARMQLAVAENTEAEASVEFAARVLMLQKRQYHPSA